MNYSRAEVLQFVKENDVKFIKLFFADIFGAIKSISVQPSVLKEAFEQGISFDASAVRGFLNVAQSDLFLRPDPATLQVLPWRPQQGRVARLFCSITYPDGSAFEGDSRLILQNVIEQAAKMGLEIKIGTECEFYLFKLDENGLPTMIPHDSAGYCDLAPLDKGENVRRAIILNLEQMGVEIEASHHETGPGQNEIDFKYDNALQSADKLSTFKMAVKTVAAQSGLFATFMPKPLKDQAGSGLHINLSLFKDGKNLFEDSFKNGLQAEAASFTAGILAHAQEITAFLNPMKQSYERLGQFEAPMYVSWSSQNRSQLIRVPAASGNASRIELRSPDPSCNHYLAIALIIAAGLDGLERKLSIPSAVDKDLYRAKEDETETLEKLPQTLAEALERTENSAFVQTVIPRKTVRQFTEFKKAEQDPPFGTL